MNNHWIKRHNQPRVEAVWQQVKDLLHHAKKRIAVKGNDLDYTLDVMCALVLARQLVTKLDGTPREVVVDRINNLILDICPELEEE